MDSQVGNKVLRVDVTVLNSSCRPRGRVSFEFRIDNLEQRIKKLQLEMK